MNADQELLAVFKAEVRERLDDLARQLYEAPGAWDLSELVRTTHSIKGAARMVEVAPIEAVAHALEDLLAAVRDEAIAADVIADPARDGCMLLEACFETFEADRPAPDVAPFVAQIRGLVPVRTAKVEPAPAATATTSAELPQEPARAPSAAGPGEAPRPGREAPGQETLRVAVAKLERLTGLAAEFVMSVYGNHERQVAARELSFRLEELRRSDARLGELPAFRQALHTAQSLQRNLLQDVGRNESLSELLQDSIRALRMVPLASLQSRFDLVVQQACAANGRRVLFAIEGGDTEIDRITLTALVEPVLHLLRNAVAHGVEPADERRRLGKSDSGRVTLKAASAGAWVELSVLDDGSGIPLERVREQARAAGSVPADKVALLSRDDLLDLIFRPGFSTAGTTDSLSGRGVGLDIVQRAVGALGGQVAVESRDEVGASFHLRVPLTRLTTKGIVVTLGGHELAVPVHDVEHTFILRQQDIGIVDGQEVVVRNGEPLPLTTLESVLGLESRAGAERPALVLTDRGRLRAIAVDEVLGQREFIIQRLSSNLRHVPGVAGATVLDNGRTALILNTAELVAPGTALKFRAQPTADAVAQRRRSILVVDDSVTSRTLLKNILASAGYEVTLATDGEEGWQALVHGEFDLLLSDVEMPRLNGFDLTRRVRGDTRLEHLPVILVTNLANPEHRREGVQVGANAHVSKGAFDQDDLLRAVARLL